jgi:hypothetical protein
MDTSNMSQDELNAHNKLVKEAVRLAKLEAQYRKDVSESISDYLKGVDKTNKLKKEYLTNLKKQKQYEDEIQNGTAEEVAAARVKLEIILKTNAAIKSQYESLNKALDSVNKKQMVASKLSAEALKGTAKLIQNMPNLIQQGFGKIKDIGLFDMDKSIRTAGLSMGLLGKQSDGFRENIKAAAWEASQVGISLQDLTQMQASYSEELGRTVILSKEGAESMAKMAADTMLGVEGASRLTAEFDAQGLSVEKTAEYMNEAMDSSHKMGLNAQKVIKNIAGNIKLLNRYNFKDGVAGLTKMAQTAAKLGVSMEFASGFADKLFDVEGAVDMSSQLQVMGGAWAKLADPFKLMYQARNDIQGLTEELGKAASASAHLNSKGEIELAAMEMHKLKIIAQQTGVSYDELAEAGKRAFKLTKIQTQVQFNMSDEEKEFLANTAQLDKNGKAYIQVGADKKFLNLLGSSGAKFVKEQMVLKEEQGKRAKDAQTFDEALSNTLMGMKQFLLPVVEVLSKELTPALEKFRKDFKDGDWGNKIANFASTVGGLISTVGKWIIENPFTTGAIMLGGFLMDKAMWFANGLLLAQGFNMGAGGGITSKGGGLFSGKAANGMAKANFGAAGLYGAAGMGVGALTDWGSQKAKDTGHKDLGKGIGVLGKSAEYALYGAAIGSLIPVLGTTIGAVAGGIIGAGKGLYDQYQDTEAINDPNTMTRGMHDGVVHGKSNFSKGRGIIQGGKITPIDNKDDLMAWKKNGPVDKAMNNQNTVNRVEFSNITIDGKIEIVSPGNPGLVIDLMKDQGFRRDITRTIQVELEKNKVGGKNKG